MNKTMLEQKFGEEKNNTICGVPTDCYFIVYFNGENNL